MKTQLVLATLVLALTLVSTMPPAAAAGTTGSWTIRTYSGANVTTTFSFPGTVNATLTPVNITTPGQRTVTIASADNASLVYFSSSIGFFPAGINATAGKVNLSWAIPISLQDGGTVTLAVGLSGVKTPESSLVLTIKQNLASAVTDILAPIISGFQNQINHLNDELNQANAALADSNFRHEQIEAVLGIGLACAFVYIVYDKRKRADRKEEVQKSAGVFDHWAISVAQENAEPGEAPAVKAAAAKPAEAAQAMAEEA